MPIPAEYGIIARGGVNGDMEFVSILDNRIKPETEERIPAFLVDLNLDQVLEKVQGLSRLPVKKYFYYFPGDRDGEAYRRAVYQDIKNEDIHGLLEEFTERMEERKRAREKKLKVALGIQKGAWHILELAGYCDAVCKLYEGLLQAKLQSEGLCNLREFLTEYVLSEEFSRMRKEALERREILQGFRVKLVYEKDQLWVQEDAVSGAYEKFLQDTLGEQGLQMKSPFSLDTDLDELEAEIIHKFARQQENFFRETRDFYHRYEEYENEVLLRLGEEAAFYLSYHAFQRKMEVQGFSFVTPTVDESKDMSACGLYDIALACTNVREHRRVVSNDMYLGKGESFFVLTGPNQGGKTTFARSLGQLVYFCKMGLDVPATAANVHYFSDILTHFSVEESVESGRGKLMDELVRLKPMMSGECRNAFVVINELFTTAANYDACIMGKKVLQHFIGQGCRGIYVTHLRELTQAHESVVSMRAMLDAQRLQSFKICRREADDSACALNQVNKYCLTYEQLKERLR